MTRSDTGLVNSGMGSITEEITPLVYYFLCIYTSYGNKKKKKNP